VGRLRVVVAVVVAVLVCGGAASARASTQELTITASDGTKLACGLVLPSGSPPAGGWPGLLLFHGLGQTHAFMETIANVAFAPVGFASLACDTRGTGGSGGKFGLDGAKEVQDVRDLFSWLAARSDVSDTQIGAFGLSLGGGAVWNAAVAGVPFKAIVPAITWTDLGSALNPNRVPKGGEIGPGTPTVPPSDWDPSFTQALNDLRNDKVTAAVKRAEAARSSRAKLRSLHVPTLMLQGRHDFLFDMDQAIAAYKLLAGPKQLYLGDLGHAPATNPTAEQPAYLLRVIAWFRAYLAGGPKPGGGIELAHDPWDGTTTHYSSLPPTRRVVVNLPGTKRIAANGSVSRAVRLTGGPLETFGDGFLSIRYSGTGALKEIRAMVAVQGSATPITVGAARLDKRSGIVKVPLLDEAELLPRGKRLVVTVGGISADGVYVAYSGGPSAPPVITIGRITLNLPVLRRTVSR
jgi:alpha-beta hydrolase superfamily lysophospholipase